MIPYFDAHCDTNSVSNRLRSTECHLDLERLKTYSPCAQVFAICTETTDAPKKKAALLLERLNSELKKNSDIVKLCLNFDDISLAASERKIAALISIEGAEQISSLTDAYSKGVRIIHPTWNFDNCYSGAALGNGKGLSEAGKQFVREAQSLGIALDMSHISERGFWDVLEIAERPVIAGHSNAKSICDVPRNISDEQFKALVSIGGGAGINLCLDFLGLGKDIDAITAHIEHFLSLGGENSVFLGCDLDGIPETPNGICGVQDISKIYEALLKRNYTETLVHKIFWGNLYNIMEKML